MGLFHCPPGSPEWHQENRIQEGPLFVFPSIPVDIAHDGDGFRVADANQVIFYNDAQRYRRKILDAQGDRCVYFRLSPGDVQDVLETFGLGPDHDPRAPFRFSRGPGSPKMYLWHLALARYVFHNHDHDEMFVHESLLELLRSAVALARDGISPQNGRSRRGEAAVREAQRILSTQYHQNLTLATLGSAVALSPFHLARQFRQFTGVSVHAYRERLRLMHGTLSLIHI